MYSPSISYIPCSFKYCTFSAFIISLYFFFAWVFSPDEKELYMLMTSRQLSDIYSLSTLSISCNLDATFFSLTYRERPCPIRARGDPYPVHVKFDTFDAPKRLDAWKPRRIWFREGIALLLACYAKRWACDKASHTLGVTGAVLRRCWAATR